MNSNVLLEIGTEEIPSSYIAPALEQMQKFGYEIIRVKSIGAVNVAGSTEATQRGTEFHHLDITGDLTSFKEDS